MTWTARLKRVFGIEIEQCARCGWRLNMIASIEDPELFERILAHRRERGAQHAVTRAAGAAAVVAVLIAPTIVAVRMFFPPP